jgi:hypothetical protein
MTHEQYEAFVSKLTDEYDGYINEFKEMASEDLIDIACQISAINDTHYYLTEEAEPEELEKLTRLANPLKALANEWERRIDDLSDMSFAIEEVVNDG